MPDPIQCRARLRQDCAHNDEEATERRVASVGNGWRQDGTYERATDTIVCDPCYVRLEPILRALPVDHTGREPVNAAIQVYRAALPA